MLRSFVRVGIAALALALASVMVSPAAHAEKHDSNTLHKLGKSIQYPFRKASENASINVHRAEGRKSVVHRRNGNKTYRAVVTSTGRIHRKYRVGHPHR